MTRKRQTWFGIACLLGVNACSQVCTLDSKPAARVHVDLTEGDDVTGLAIVMWRVRGEAEWTECRGAHSPGQPWTCASGMTGELVVRAEYQELGDFFAAEESLFVVRGGACDHVRTQDVTLVLDAP